MLIRVVVADDFPLVCDGVAAALERDPGIAVVGRAANGEEALGLARELEPDVIVLDMSMPGLGGIGVLERLRDEMPKIRALMLTASDSPESLLGAVSSGAQGYLSKLTGPETLRQAVITIHGDGSVIEPRLGRHLLREYVSGQDTTGLRPVLSARESEILRLVARGQTDNEIGRELYLSPRTVQNHLTRVREKTGMRRRSQLTRWAVEHALV